MKKAVFLDRDGTIIEEKHYLRDPEQVVLIPGAATAISLLAEKGYYIVMVSNQSGVARGYFDEEDVIRVNQRVQELLREHGAAIDAMYYCPHHPDGNIAKYKVDCSCRKPKSGMGIRASQEHDLDLSKSYMIGDKIADVEFARNCGMKNGFLVKTGHGKEQVLLKQYGKQATDILHAAKMILEME